MQCKCNRDTYLPAVVVSAVNLQEAPPLLIFHSDHLQLRYTYAGRGHKLLPLGIMLHAVSLCVVLWERLMSKDMDD